MGLLRDLRVGGRGLTRRPGFTAAVVAALALGIGSTTAIFTLLKALFREPLPVASADGLVGVFRTADAGNGTYTGFNAFSHADYLDLRERSRTLSPLALYQWLPVNLSGGIEPERATAMFASAGYFELLGVRPFLGRFFDASADRPGEVRSELVLSHACWRRLFGGDAGAVGRHVILNGHPFDVVGVTPPRFGGTEITVAVDAWIPLMLFPEIAPYRGLFADRSAGLFRVIGRLAPGVGLDEARAETLAIAEQLAAEHPQEAGRRRTRVEPLLETTIHPRERESFLGYGRSLAGAVALILLVAAINVANLLLMRGAEHARELAVCQALGADRGTLVRHLFGEFGLLFLFGGVLALPLGQWTLALLWSLRPPELAQAQLDLALDWEVLGFGALVTLVTVAGCGLPTLLRSSRPDLVESLRAGHGSSRVGAGRGRWGRSALLVGQLTLALVGLLGAGLFFASLERARRIDLGFDPQGLAVATVAPGDLGLAEEATRGFYDQLLERVRALPGVRAAALSENRLLRGAILRYEVYPEGRTEPLPSGENLLHRTNIVSSGFFAAAGIPLLAGRDFAAEDCPSCPPAVVINRTLAEAAWPGEPAVGRRLHLTGPQHPVLEVVGVVENARYRAIQEAPQFFLYLPLSQRVPAAMTLHARSAGRPEGILPAVRREIQALQPGLPVAQAGAMEQFVASALWIEHTSAALLRDFALLALVLAAVGVYSTMAYSVRQRRHEIGIRLALGAHRGRIFCMVLGEAALLAGIATALGGPLALLALKPLVAGQLLGAGGFDAPGTGLQVLVLLGAAVAGSIYPARRAAGLPPIEPLKEE